MKRIVLASASPRRSELMKRFFTEDFETRVSDFKENSSETDPLKIAVGFAKGKAHDVAARVSHALVIAADTIVTIDGRILGKPADRDEARKMMTLLSGRTHEVVTGVCIVDADTGKEEIDWRKTKVHMSPLPEEFIEAYIRSEEPYDKAGGYAI
ncbi:MAG: septum formation protein Maf, partial [Eubacteriales bacterium]|nr:septum formation protein Maf [Eubacteriales bacterium]